MDDRCPFTPQRYDFLSNAMSDFDGDGCADGVEDHDDDGDLVLNMADRCPRTQPGHAADGTGCSRLQLEDEAAGRCTQVLRQEAAAVRLSPQALPADANAREAEKEEATWQHYRSDWIALICSTWVQVLLGAALSSLVGYASQLAGNIHQQLPTTPQEAVGSVRRISSQALDAANKSGPSARKLGVRAVIYTLFFCTVYAYRALKHVELPPGFPF